MNLKYLAGIFDTRGFLRFDYGRSYSYQITFNFTEREKNLWIEIKKEMESICVPKIYKLKRKKGRLQEYQLCISGKKNTYNFLIKILPFSKRKEEILTMLKVLTERGRGLKDDKVAQKVDGD